MRCTPWDITSQFQGVPRPPTAFPRTLTPTSAGKAQAKGNSLGLWMASSYLYVHAGAMFVLDFSVEGTL